MAGLTEYLELFVRQQEMLSALILIPENFA
jgi:hypothetical protein